MDVEQLENGSFSNETVALLILNELRMMRRDMNAGMMRLEAKVDYLYQNRKEMDRLSTDSENVVMVPVDSNTENVPEPPITRIFSGPRKAQAIETSETKTNSETQQDNEEDEEDEIPEYTVHVDVSDLPDDVDEEQLYEESQVEEYNSESFEIDEKNNPEYQKDKNSTVDDSAINGAVQTDDGRFQCDMCSNSYSSRGNLQRHRRFHTGDKRYQCSVCARQFFRNEYLLRHMKKHTNGSRKRRTKKTDAEASEEAKKIRTSLTCQICHRAFTLPNNLKRHMRIHTGEKPYACDLCGLKFSRDDFLKSHMRKVHNY